MQFPLWQKLKFIAQMRFLLSNSRGLVENMQKSVALSQIVASSPKFIIEGLDL